MKCRDDSYLIGNKFAAKKHPLRRVSKKRAPDLRKYAKLKAETLPDSTCENPNGCWKQATQVHHSRGRQGKLLNDRRYWFLLCTDCHRWVHDHPNDARKLGLLT